MLPPPCSRPGNSHRRLAAGLRVRVLLVLVLVLVLPAACSTSASSTTLAQAKKAGVLRAGTEGTYSPFSYHDPATNALTG